MQDAPAAIDEFGYLGKATGHLKVVENSADVHPDQGTFFVTEERQRGFVGIDNGPGEIGGDDPFEGIGKPEALKHALSGYWSRRITDEHRIVYRIEKDAVLIAQLRYHY